MQKRHPARGGVDLLGGDLRNPTKIRPVLQANAAMQSRLALLRWCDFLQKEKAPTTLLGAAGANITIDKTQPTQGGRATQ
jgi:hypothetical protein